MKSYRVQKVTPNGEVIEEYQVRAPNPDMAAASVVTGKLRRGNKGHRSTLRAKVYTLDAGQPMTLVRFYEREDETDRNEIPWCCSSRTR